MAFGQRCAAWRTSLLESLARLFLAFVAAA
jgi:hypothetical protein